MELRVRIYEHTGCFLSQKNAYYYMPKDQLFKIFLPDKYTYKIVGLNEKADICLFSIQLEDKKLLRPDEINILICIENCFQWNWYKHYLKYYNFNNDLVNIYIYNHIPNLMKNEKYLVIPTVYSRINYFLKIQNEIQLNETPFKEKKFCLVTNRSNLNNEINQIVDALNRIDQVDNINLYNEELQDTTCYNDPVLLNILNRYKFVICFENSYSEGYVTEKIFNCFLAKTIPIYKGSPIIDQYLNTKSFINIQQIDSYDCSEICNIMNDENLYNKIINENKISTKYSDENYQNLMENYISTHLPGGDN